MGRRHKAPGSAAKKVILSVNNSQTMISPSKGRYDMLLLQPDGPSLHMTAYIHETGEPPRTTKAQTIWAKEETNS